MQNEVTDTQSRSEKNKMASIARMSFKDEKSQKEIAAHFNISQAEVSRYIRQAKKLGIVRIHIDSAFNGKVESILKEKFDHLQRVIIVPHMPTARRGVDPALVQALGMECAQYLLTRVTDRAKIGVSSGKAVEASVSALGKLHEQGVPMPYGCMVLPLSSKLSLDVGRATQVAVVAQLGRCLPGSTAKGLQLPSVSLDAKGAKQVQAYRKNPQIRELLSEIERLHCYVIGIGAIDYEGEEHRMSYDRPAMSAEEFNAMIWKLGLVEILKEYDAVGEMLSQPFDREGKCLIDSPALTYLKDAVLNASLDVLGQHVERKSALIIAVAGGEIKHQAIHAAIRAKIFNVLVTDSTTAEYVLTEEGVRLD